MSACRTIKRMTRRELSGSGRRKEKLVEEEKEKINNYVKLTI